MSNLKLRTAAGGSVTLTPENVAGDVTLTVPGDNSTLVSAADLSAFTGASGVGYLPAGTGAVTTTVQSKLRESISIIDFGADPLGVSDSGSAFRAAALYMEMRGGGDIIVPYGLYRAASVDASIEWPKDERHVVYIGSNIRIISEKGARFWLDGATLCANPLFTTGGNRFNCIGIKQGASNSSVTGLTFTTNGWRLDIAFRTCFGVTIGGDDCLVDDCYFDNMPGHNMIGVGYNNPSWPAYNCAPVGAKILRNTFHNGSKNVSGNTAATDCSFIYVNGNGALIDGNRFFNDSAPVTNCGGVEMHGSNITVSNNVFKNLWPGVYTGFQVGGSVSVANKILSNRFDSCAGGVQTIDLHSDLTIENNSFVNVLAMSSTKAYGTAIFSSLNGITGASSGYVRDAKIVGNVIREDTPIYKNAMAIAGLQGSIISSNILDGGIGLGVSGASDVDTDGVLVSNNIVRNPPLSPAFNSGAFSASGGDGYNSVIKNVTFRDNIVVANAGTVNTYLLIAAGTGTTLANVLATGNQVVNASNAVAGTQGAQVNFESGDAETFSSVWSQSSGTQPSVGNGSILFKYKKSGKKVEVWFRFVAGSTTTFGNNATPWEFSLPAAASSLFVEQNSTIEIYDGGSVMNFASLSIPAGESKFRINYQNQTVRLNWPFVSVSGMVIRGQFSYITA